MKKIKLLASLALIAGFSATSNAGEYRGRPLMQLNMDIKNSVWVYSVVKQLRIGKKAMLVLRRR